MNTENSATDSGLYNRFLRGEINAYDQLMVRYGDSLVLYLNGYLHDWDEAEDQMVEAFARIMVKKPRISEGAFKAYLFRTGRNLALRFQERKRRIQFFSIEGMEETSGSALPLMRADTEDVPDQLIRKERSELLHKCLGQIEPELREALWLVYGEGMRYAEVASVMGVTVKRVDRLLSRGKQEMKKELEREGITNAYE